MKEANFELLCQKLDPKAVIPTRAHADDAGMDLYGLESGQLNPGEGRLFRTGVAMAIPTGFVGMIADRSSLGKKGIKVAGGIVDAGYRGEVQVILWNWSGESIQFQAGDRIAQMLIFPITTPAPVSVAELPAAKRGMGGFGSTGR